MMPVICSNPKCKGKVVGELEVGKARFKCKACGTYTTIEVSKPAPRSMPYQERMNMLKK